MSTPDDHPCAATHQIRLGSQWDFELLPAAAPSSDKPLDRPRGDTTRPKRLKTVTEWPEAAGAGYRGRVRLLRWFGRPSGLTPDDRLEIVIVSLQEAVVATFNGDVLPPPPTANSGEPDQAPMMLRYDVSALLHSRNLLSIEFDVPETPNTSEVIRDVRLEIFA